MSPRVIYLSHSNSRHQRSDDRVFGVAEHSYLGIFVKSVGALVRLPRIWRISTVRTAFRYYKGEATHSI
jgi:hypothetical protein